MDISHSDKISFFSYPDVQIKISLLAAYVNFFVRENDDNVLDNVIEIERFKIRIIQ